MKHSKCSDEAKYHAQVVHARHHCMWSFGPCGFGFRDHGRLVEVACSTSSYSNRMALDLPTGPERHTPLG